MLIEKRIDQAVKAPFIGCFKTPSKHYIYDVNRNEIICVNKNSFLQLSECVNRNKEIHSKTNMSDPSIRNLLEEGYLSSHRCKDVKVPMSRDKYLYESSTQIRHCVLELTQKCNHDCQYCCYSKNFPGRRNHSRKSMSWETAKASVDLLIANSKDTESVTLGYYGGEPLLNLDLFYKCSEYFISECTKSNKKHTFNFTTNGTLIDQAIAEYCAEKDMYITISLDGDKNAHDAKRKILGSDQSSYELVIEGLKTLKRAYRGKYEYYISLNCVYGPWTSNGLLFDFFKNKAPDVVKELHVKFNDAMLPYDNPAESETAPGSLDENLMDVDNPVTNIYTQWFERLSSGEFKDDKEKFLLTQYCHSSLLTFYKRDKSPLKEYLGIKGMCFPGLRKCYVDVEGNILPCERVPEIYNVGHVFNKKIDVDKGLSICANIRDLIKALDCTNCIFCRICSGCLAGYVNEKGEMDMESARSFCLGARDMLKELLVQWVMVLENNPTAFDYMADYQIQ